MSCASILFLDFTCPAPYSAETLATSPMGGTEATVVRVAEGLSKQGFKVQVAQHNRSEASGIYVPLASAVSRPDAVVILRTPSEVPKYRKQYPDSKLFLWMHDFVAREIASSYASLHEQNVKVLAVSRTHKGSIVDGLLNQVPNVKGVTVDFVYNPIDDELRPDNSEVFHRRLVFFSSPHKGLRQTLEVFKHLRRIDRYFELRIANPGYYQDGTFPKYQGVKNLGSLSHAAVIKEVRQALCVLHVNPVFPETFGLVHAEALAVGTPIVTGHLGANPEVVRDQRFMLDCRNERAIIDRVMLFAEERPTTKCPDEFRLTNVLKQWRGLLGA